MFSMPRSLKTTKVGMLMVLGALCFLLTVYFAWEILYQEPTIVKILTVANIRKDSQKQDLEEFLKDWMNETKVPSTRKERAVSNTKRVVYSEVRSESSYGNGRLSVHSEIIRRQSVDISYDYTMETSESNGMHSLDTATSPVNLEDDSLGMQNVVDDVIHRLINSHSTDDTDRQRQEHLGVKYLEEYAFQPLDRATLEADCVDLKVSPPVPICLYPSERDVFISAQIRSSGLWEEHIVREFERVLAANPTIGVIDAGANIGMYSLIAARMGHRVVAIEPSPENLRLFQRAVELAGLRGDRIRIYRNAVADAHGLARLVPNPSNQGDTQIRLIPETLGKPLNYIDAHINSSTVKTITLNDIVSVVEFEQAVIKIDVQNFEHIAFTQAAKLLDAVDVRYIFMEWVLMREFYVTDVHKSADKDMVERMVRMLDARGYTPYSLVTGMQLKTPYWFGWPEDVVWRK